jgi:hypothetical protein
MTTKVWAAVLVMSLSVGAAVAQHVHTDYDHKAPFSDYRTFSIAKVQTVNPLDADVIRQELRNDLQYHGWREVPRGGDVAITVVGAQQDTKQYQTFYDGLGPGFGWGGWGGWWGAGWGDGMSSTTVRTIPVGTLVVDLYDTRTHNLVWRGMSTETDTNSMNKNAGKLQKAVDEMFYKFPPKHAE